MRLTRRNRALRSASETANRTLQQWRVDASVDGVLRIQPAGPVLRHRELADFLESVRGALDDGVIRHVIIDLARVETIGPQWTVVLAMLLDFANTVRAECHVVSLRGQPAAVAAFYQRNRAVARLVMSDDPPDAQPHRQRAIA